jgi:hypothetical protein
MHHILLSCNGFNQPAALQVAGMRRGRPQLVAFVGQMARREAVDQQDPLAAESNVLACLHLGSAFGGERQRARTIV